MRLCHVSWCHVESHCTSCVFGPVWNFLKRARSGPWPAVARCWMGYLDPEAVTDEETGGFTERCKTERSERSAERSEPKEPVVQSWLRGFTIVLFNFTTSIMLVNSVKCLYDAAPKRDFSCHRVFCYFCYTGWRMSACPHVRMSHPNPRIGVASNSLSSLLVHTWSSLGSPQQWVYIWAVPPTLCRWQKGWRRSCHSHCSTLRPWHAPISPWPICTHHIMCFGKDQAWSATCSTC